MSYDSLAGEFDVYLDSRAHEKNSKYIYLKDLNLVQQGWI